MARTRRTLSPSPHRWRPLPLRLHASLRAALDQLARRDGWPLAALIRHACQEYLRREGLWPPRDAAA